MGSVVEKGTIVRFEWGALVEAFVEDLIINTMYSTSFSSLDALINLEIPAYRLNKSEVRLRGTSFH